MKYFSVQIHQQDGEHEHLYNAVASGYTSLEVQTRLRHEQDYEFGEESAKSLVAFGDGLTSAWSTLREIPESDYSVLRKYLSEV